MRVLGAQALDSLVRKSGCDEPITAALRERLTVRRFTSTKCTLPYTSYLDAVSKGASPSPLASASPSPRMEWPPPSEGAQATPRSPQ